MMRQPPRSTLLPCTTLFRSSIRRPARAPPDRSPGRVDEGAEQAVGRALLGVPLDAQVEAPARRLERLDHAGPSAWGAEVRTSELQSRQYLACRHLLEKQIPQ